MKDWIERNGIVSAVVSVILGLAGGAFLASRTALWQAQQDISAMRITVSAIEADVQRVRRAVARMALNPGDVDAVQELLTSEGAKRGLLQFEQGQVVEAFGTWSTAAASGSVDAELALDLAAFRIRKELEDPRLPEARRSALENALQRYRFDDGSIDGIPVKDDGE